MLSDFNYFGLHPCQRRESCGRRCSLASDRVDFVLGESPLSKLRLPRGPILRGQARCLAELVRFVETLLQVVSCFRGVSGCVGLCQKVPLKWAFAN